MQRLWGKVAVAAAALVIVVVGLIPFLVNADTFRPTLEDQLSRAMGRKLTLGHLSFSPLTGSLVAQNISVADDPAFGTSPFLEAKSLSIGVETGPLLFHRQVRITKLSADSPSINLIHAQSGLWNFSSLGGATASHGPEQMSALPNLTVGEFAIKNGSATVSTLPATGKPLAYTDINLSIQKLAFAKSFPFQLSAKLPGAGTVDLKGNAGPLEQKNAADTPFRATLQVKHFDPVSAGIVDPSHGISMVADIDTQLASDGGILTGTGKIQAAHLQLARNGSPAPQPVDIDFSISDNPDTRTGTISDLSLHTGPVAAHVKGSYRSTPQGIEVDLHVAAPNLPIDSLEQLLPAFGVRLPSGSALRGGTLTANLAVTGLATAATITGPIEIDNTRLAGFDLGSRIEGTHPFGSKGGGTEIQTLRAQVNSSPQSTQLTSIYGNLPQIGTASGNGTVSASGALDFRLVAQFSTTSAVGAIAGKAVNVISGMIGSFLRPKNSTTTTTTSPRGIPITVTGTATNPSIRANFAALLK